MATTVGMLKEWFAEGKKQKATHMIVACDTFDWEDYPVYVKKGQDVHEVEASIRNQSMQKIMEVYDLQAKMNAQMQPGTLVRNYGSPKCQKPSKKTK